MESAALLSSTLRPGHLSRRYGQRRRLRQTAICSSPMCAAPAGCWSRFAAPWTAGPPQAARAVPAVPPPGLPDACPTTAALGQPWLCRPAARPLCWAPVCWVWRVLKSGVHRTGCISRCPGRPSCIQAGRRTAGLAAAPHARRGWVLRRAWGAPASLCSAASTAPVPVQASQAQAQGPTTLRAAARLTPPAHPPPRANRAPPEPGAAVAAMQRAAGERGGERGSGLRRVALAGGPAAPPTHLQVIYRPSPIAAGQPPCRRSPPPPLAAAAAPTTHHPAPTCRPPPQATRGPSCSRALTCPLHT